MSNEEYEKLRADVNSRTCKTCRYYEFEGIDKGCVCVCDKSDYLGDWVGAQYTCMYWEDEINKDAR